MSATEDVEFRPTFGRGLTVAVGVLCAATLVVTAWGDVWSGVRLAPLLALVTVTVWALFGRPAVVVSPSGVELRNVLRTVELPWPSIELIDTKYALTLHTAYGVYAAWAAPAPSRSQAQSAAPGDAAHRYAAGGGAGGVRPGDLAGTPSGEAAALVRSRWEELRDAGHLDTPQLERPRPRVRWHTATLATLVVLAALSALALRA
ncbi:PH domain-containing protein [Cellulomonas sp. P22]|uniref:PH domain-containing protein n=1 Tax=Cellulomonas sp. P22 TaxID=3373189 RepID=UPI00379FD470